MEGTKARKDTSGKYGSTINREEESTGRSSEIEVLEPSVSHTFSNLSLNTHSSNDILNSTGCPNSRVMLNYMYVSFIYTQKHMLIRLQFMIKLAKVCLTEFRASSDESFPFTSVTVELPSLL